MIKLRVYGFVQPELVQISSWEQEDSTPGKVKVGSTASTLLSGAGNEQGRREVEVAVELQGVLLLVDATTHVSSLSIRRVAGRDNRVGYDEPLDEDVESTSEISIAESGSMVDTVAGDG